MPIQDDHRDIIEALDRKIEDAINSLASAKQAAQDIPFLEGEVARLKSAKLALTAPQTPDGRKRIGQAQRGRKKADTASSGPFGPFHLTPTRPSAATICSQCKRPFDAGDSQYRCPVDGCEGFVHAVGCVPAHNDRWHKEEQK